MENVNTTKASARFVRISSRKMNQVADIVRRKTAVEAIKILSFVTKKGAPILRGIISSAVSNAEMNHNMSADSLVIDQILVEQGPTLKRFRPAPMGRANRIRKRTTHTTVVLKEDPALVTIPAPEKSKTKKAKVENSEEVTAVDSNAEVKSEEKATSGTKKSSASKKEPKATADTKKSSPDKTEKSVVKKPGKSSPKASSDAPGMKEE